jgi:2-oxoglutarate dehydrogenase E2 component (dihydrolipoamide succinyltransferase)
MAQYELLLPKMGESVAEATLIKWVKNVGDTILADDTILEIATDKVDTEVPSPVSGKLIKQLYKEDDVVQVGDVIAIIETDSPGETVEERASETTAVAPEPQDPAPLSSSPTTSIENAPEVLPGIELLTKEDVVSYAGENSSPTSRFYSPLVKSIAVQEGLTSKELDQISGTGAEGRLTKDDLLNYIGSKNNSAGATNGQQSGITEEKTTTAFHSVNKPAAAIVKAVTPLTSVSGGDEIIEMDRMRRLIADHMVMSKQTSPHVTSFVEADVTNMVLWRERVKRNFEKRENEKITFTPIFIEVIAKAIRDFPMINVSVNGTQIIKKRDINIGMAAALPSGNLIVPVIKNADQLNLVGLTKSVNDLATRARNSKLKPDETQNGTFTLTNVGSFGNVMGTPIINQPQAAILAVGAIKKKPAVLETEFGDVIAIRHMMFLSLSYDHRVVDGSLGGSFVKRVAEYLENWDVNREI